MTDVTGFGLGGHLAEMLEGSGLTPALDPDALPILPGTLEILAQGIESSLAPTNGPAAAAYAGGNEALAAILSDPQTSGGLALYFHRNAMLIKSKFILKLERSNHKPQQGW